LIGIYEGSLESLLGELSYLRAMPDFYMEGHGIMADEIRSLGAEAFLHADSNYRDHFTELGRIWDLIHPLDVHPFWLALTFIAFILFKANLPP